MSQGDVLTVRLAVWQKESFSLVEASGCRATAPLGLQLPGPLCLNIVPTSVLVRITQTPPIPAHVCFVYLMLENNVLPALHLEKWCGGRALSAPTDSRLTSRFGGCLWTAVMCGCLLSQASSTKAVGRTSSSPCSPPWFPPWWGTDGAGASLAPAVTDRLRGTSSWPPWLWPGALMEASMSATSTSSAASTPLETWPASWSSGKNILFSGKTKFWTTWYWV